MNKKVTTIYVVRHGESEGNLHSQNNPNLPFEKDGKFGSPLTAKGREQAKVIGAKLKDIGFASFFSSDLIRARETAEIIAKEHGLHVTTNATIRERNWGSTMTKQVREEIEKALQNLNDEEKLAYKYFPNGESGLDAVKRFISFLGEIVQAYTGQKILVVNHGNVMRSFLVNLGFAKYDELPSGSIENTAYFVLEADGNNYSVKEHFGIHKNKLAQAEE